MLRSRGGQCSQPTVPHSNERDGKAGGGCHGDEAVAEPRYLSDGASGNLSAASVGLSAVMRSTGDGAGGKGNVTDVEVDGSCCSGDGVLLGEWQGGGPLSIVSGSGDDGVEEEGSVAQDGDDAAGVKARELMALVQLARQSVGSESSLEFLAMARSFAARW